MNKLLIANARLINEGEIRDVDVLIEGERISRIAASIAAEDGVEVIDAAGRYLMPGMIDDQVHFREPGLTRKGDLATESAAAVAGGITSFMDMPNVNPQTTTVEALADKYQLARGRCPANTVSTSAGQTKISKKSKNSKLATLVASRSSWVPQQGICSSMTRPCWTRSSNMRR